MKTTKRSAVTFAAAGAVAMLLGSAPAFAAPQYQGRETRTTTVRTERVQMQGRVRSFTRERDGYRVYLDQDQRSFWVPASRLDRELRVGLNIGFGGIFNGGLVTVDAVTWPDAVGYGNNGNVYGRGDNGYGRGNRQSVALRGFVERVDYRNGTLWLRDGRQVTRVIVNDRDLRSVHRGDRVALEGRWQRDGDFTAYRINGIR